MHRKATKRSRFLRRAGQLTAAVLCLRALIPAGFMLAPVDGHLEMVFCDAAAPKPIHHPPMAHVHDMSGMEHGGPEHAASEHGVTGYAHADPTCPYAQSAGPAPLPAVAVLATAEIAHTLAVGETGTQIQSAFGPRRTQTPRAPPLLV